MWDANPKELQQITEDVIGPRIIKYELRFRAMFGGILAYAYGRPFASLSNAGIAIKLIEQDKQALIDEHGGYPLRYEPSDPPSKSYVVIPMAMVEAKGEELEAWLLKSIIYVKTLPLSKKKPKKL
jgi:TfoX/Sxy family transcriptional regulator of competence genes